MKRCCEIGGDKPPSKIETWASRIRWGIIILLVTILAIIQIFNA